VRRVIFSIVLITLVAVPALALGGPPRVYSGPIVGVVLKQNKDVVKSGGVGPPPAGIPLQCDEGATREQQSFSFETQPKLKHRRFHVKITVTFVFETIDDTGTVVNRDKAPFTVVVHGRFKPKFKKVTGTLSFSGSYSGPTQGPNGSDVQFHNCSGPVQWAAHKGF
jgi:hypothetical protein